MTVATSNTDLVEAGARHLLLHFTRNGSYGPGRAPLMVVDRGEGPYVWDTSGKRYIDALSCLMCAQIGYSYGAEMGEVAAAQLERLPFNTVWGTAHQPAIELGQRLAELAPGELNQVFFTLGGSDSVEAAWKLARSFHLANGEPERTKAIARKTAYHGSTLGALALTGVPRYKEPFGPPAVEVRHVSNTGRFRAPDAGDEAAFCHRLLAEIEAVIQQEGPETIALIFAEPMQTVGGCFTPPPGYWQGLRDIADRYGILLGADEVVTAFGRFGEWFGSYRYGGQPDLITCAKGITSSYAPLGAVLVADRVGDAFRADPKMTLLHGVTFAGHPISTAIGLKNLEIIERDGVIENVRTLEPHFKARLEELRSLPIVGDVRGAGFGWALELVKGSDNERFDADERERLVRGFLPKRLLEAGIIARPDDRGEPCLHLAPPLICSKEELDLIVDGVAEVLDEAGRHMQLAEAQAAA